MKDLTQDAPSITNEAKASRKRVKPRTLREDALAAGLAAFEALETSEVATRPVTITARDLVRDGIESIMRSRARGVPLLRIYSDAKKAARLRISFQTFMGYVSEFSKEKGLRLVKNKAETGSSTRPATVSVAAPVIVPVVAPAVVQASPKASPVTAPNACPACGDARFMRSPVPDRPNAFLWNCKGCRAAYMDAAGKPGDKLA